MGDYFRDYTKQPMNAAQYTMMRGVTDFTNAAQLNMFEKGHGILVIIDKPKFIEMIAEEGDSTVKSLLDNFCNILEYEFKGLSGIEDISAEDLEYTDGISQIAGIGKVTEQSNSDITMRFTEKSGSTITKFIKFYLDGVRDSRTQTKHYHGLIAQGKLALGFENEVFNFLYLVTDASGLALEAAYLLANAWPNKATTSIYEVEKGAIETAEIDVTFKCFVLRSQEIDKRALQMLAHLNAPMESSNAVANAIGAMDSQESKLNSGEAAKVTKHAHDNDGIQWDSQRFDYENKSKSSTFANMTKIYSK